MNFLLAAAIAVSAAGDGRFNPKNLDTKVSPCEDFYKYACGGWLASNEIPADRSAWGQYHELSERNEYTVKGLLEKAPAGQKSGEFYRTCMDEAAIEAKGAAPLKPALDRVAALKREDLAAETARVHKEGGSALFGYFPSQDFADSAKMIAWTMQGGLGLPDRDYYFKDDEKSVKLRAEYLKHAAAVFVLLGQDQPSADADAKRLMDFEVQLASASRDKVAMREPKKMDNKMTMAQLKAMAPGFDWEAYFAAAPGPKVDSLNVAVPAFMTRVGELAANAPMEQWKAYLRYHAVKSWGRHLSKPFVDRNFEFYSKTLQGIKELKPRWKRCVDMTTEHLGEDVGKLYVEATFGDEGKRRMKALVGGLFKAMKADIDSVTWMTPPTKTKANEKLSTFVDKIGYPDKWRDYSALEIKAGDHFGNVARGDFFEWRRQLEKIGKPIDRAEWHLPPSIVNAYYEPQMNEIVFPAGILQPPFFDLKGDDAMNYGAIGMVIGHEITHGFDDEGRQYDAKGNLKDWWTAEDSKRFEEKAACFEKQYSEFKVDDLNVNGKLTLGENTADNGGMRIAYAALMDTLKGKKPAKIDGFTPDQRFFLGLAGVWCSKYRPEYRRMLILTDPHSPPELRVNGTVMNMPEFARAFSCKPGQPMVRRNACRVW